METKWPALLATYLDSMEAQIYKELSDPRTSRGKRGKPIPGVYGANLRQLDLMQALEGLAAAREELARYPDGARLAMLVSGVELDRLRLPVETETRRYQGGRKGARAPKLKATQHAAQRHAEIRQKNAEIRKKNPTLSTAGRAARLAKTFHMSVDRIRHIIGK